MSRLSARGPAWERLRGEALRRAGYRCHRCRKPGRLECHHVRQLRSGGPKLPPVAGLRVLCRGCHIELHRPIPKTAAAREWRAFAAELRESLST